MRNALKLLVIAAIVAGAPLAGPPASALPTAEFVAFFNAQPPEVQAYLLRVGAERAARQPGPRYSNGPFAIPTHIVDCESGGNDGKPPYGNYDAQNPTSSASGAYQIIDSTWAGYGGYRKARYAPAHIQDQKAAALWAARGSSPWSSCL